MKVHQARVLASPARPKRRFGHRRPEPERGLDEGCDVCAGGRLAGRDLDDEARPLDVGGPSAGPGVGCSNGAIDHG